MSPMIKDRVAAKWPGIPLCKILEIKEGEECAVIGTLYKEMKLKPSILDEYTKEPSVRVLTANTKFVQASRDPRSPLFSPSCLATLNKSQPSML